MIVPYAPGGSIDPPSRILAQTLSQFLGQQVVVDFRAGGGATLGTAAAAKTAPDGYTLTTIGTPQVISQYLSKTAGYDLRKDFEPIGLFLESTAALVVNADLPVHSVREFIEYAKSRRGKLNYGSGGGFSHVMMEAFKLAAGIDLLNVPYRGDGPAMTAIMSGDVQAMILLTTSTAILSNKVRVLAVTSPERVAALPTVPTMREAQFPDMELTALTALVAPRGTPPDIINKISAGLASVSQSKETKDLFERVGATYIFATPHETAIAIDKQLNFYEKVVKASNITAD